MRLLVLVYFVLTVSVGGSTIWHGHAWQGISLIIGSIICFMAGSGARGGLYMGQRRSAIAIGAALAIIGMGVAFFTEAVVNLFGFNIAGDSWAGIAALVGWFAAKPEDAGVQQSAVTANEGAEDAANHQGA